VSKMPCNVLLNALTVIYSIAMNWGSVNHYLEKRCCLKTTT
jgi:hypothetical protein